PVISIFEIDDYHAQVSDAAKLLRDGKLVVLPTETVYGAAGLLTDAGALSRLKQIRGEGDGAPLTIHLAHCEDASRYLGPVSDLANRMMTKLWPGPVAIQFDVPPERQAEVAKQLNVPQGELYHRGTITLRCPDHRITNDILSEVDGPVVLTRAGQDPE